MHTKCTQNADKVLSRYMLLFINENDFELAEKEFRAIQKLFHKVTKCIKSPARNTYFYHSECPDEKLWNEHVRLNWCAMKCHEWARTKLSRKFDFYIKNLKQAIRFIEKHPYRIIK